MCKKSSTFAVLNEKTGSRHIIKLLFGRSLRTGAVGCGGRVNEHVQTLAIDG